MKLLTKDIREQAAPPMAANRPKSKAPRPRRDFPPVVKLFYPAGTEHLASHRARSRRRGCGLGPVRSRHGISRNSARCASANLKASSGRAGLRIERDKFFEAKAPISRYIDAADDAGCIVENVQPSPASQPPTEE